MELGFWIDFTFGPFAAMAPDVTRCGFSGAAIGKFAGTNKLKHPAQSGLVFGGRSRRSQTGDSGIDDILRTRKTQPSGIEVVCLGHRVHHRPSQIVASDGEYQLFGDHVHALAAQCL